MPSESRTRLESGKRSAAPRKNAAEEMSPGTVASMAFSFCPPEMERRAGWLVDAGVGSGEGGAEGEQCVLCVVAGEDGFGDAGDAFGL